MLVGPEVASRLRRHAAELSNAIGRSGSSSEEAGDLQEVISTRGMMSLRTPYWSVSDFLKLHHNVRISGRLSWRHLTVKL